MRLLAGISFVDPAGTLIRRQQFAGVVAQVVDGVVELDVGLAEPVLIPADSGCYQPARPGTYRLQETGEEIVDPDYLTTWTVVLHDG